jgi:hypothetical protein
LGDAREQASNRDFAELSCGVDIAAPSSNAFRTL